MAKSEFEFWLQCSINDQCIYYTWFSPKNEDVSKECILFSLCQTINECNGDGGCYLGQVDCYEPTTTHTTITPVLTITASELCNDNVYLILDEQTRNMNYGHVIVITLVMVQQALIGRVIGPAGSKIPETFVELKHCNTGAPGSFIL